MSKPRKHDKRGRSKGELGSFVALERYLLNSPAWRALRPVARAAYLELASGYDGRNNGKIAMSARILGDRLGMDKATGSRALAELEANGFIQCLRNSCFSQKAKRAREYRLTAFKCDVTGDLAAKTFMRWTPNIQNTVAPVHPHGCISATIPTAKTPKEALQLHPCNREGASGMVHGCTSAPLLYSSHRLADLQSSEAQAGVARQGANALPSQPQPEDCFIPLASLALKSLSHLDRGQPIDQKSSQLLIKSRPETKIAAKAA